MDRARSLFLRKYLSNVICSSLMVCLFIRSPVLHFSLSYHNLPSIFFCLPLIARIKCIRFGNHSDIVARERTYKGDNIIHVYLDEE